MVDKFVRAPSWALRGIRPFTALVFSDMSVVRPHGCLDVCYISIVVPRFGHSLLISSGPNVPLAAAARRDVLVSRRGRGPLHPLLIATRCRADSTPSYTVHSDEDDSDFVTVEQFGHVMSPDSGWSIAEGVARQPRETPWFCKTCRNTGFVPCRACGASGIVKRAHAANVFFCDDCCGKKKLRCPECGGKCYMCE